MDSSNRNIARTPNNTRIYAVGDIHGRDDLLKLMHELILEDALSADESTQKIIIYIGDYIDRCNGSKKVIDLLTNPLDGFQQIFLKGNHEHIMLSFLQDYAIGQTWLGWGGETTVQSYGIDYRGMTMLQMQQALKVAMPDSHVKFFNNLKVNHIEGDYFFVHAGINPEHSLDGQQDIEMMMIRDKFFNEDYPCADKTIIFGHTIFKEPLQKSGKIGIDTGAYKTNKLTTVILEGETVRFIST